MGISDRRDELESIVVGILLSNPQLISKVQLSVEDFCQTGRWAMVFLALRAVVADGLEVDVYGVSERVSTVTQPELIELVMHARSSSNIEHYVKLLKSEYRKSKLVELCSTAMNGALQGHDPDSVRGNLVRSLAEIDDRDRVGQNLSMSDLIGMTVDHLDEVSEAKKRGVTIGVPTGIRGLDKNCGGMHASNLIIVGAPPGIGKTAFAISVAVSAAQSGRRVGIISTEMSGLELGLRLVAMASGVANSKLRDASMTAHDYEVMNECTRTIQDLPIMVFDSPACTISRIMMQARSWMLTGGIDLLIVDYLQRLQAEGREENRSREVGKFASGMKTIARTLKIPVMALSQINRGFASRADKRPQMSDLRDSGEIEQEADSIWMLYRESEYVDNADPHEAEVIIEKNRHGPTALVKARWEPEIMRWSSYAEPTYKKTEREPF